MSNRVYLDHSATTPTDPRVVEVMLPYFSEVYGNALSAHSFGRKAEQAIEDARATIAAILHCKPSEIIFTSGGSESDNLALRGAAWANREQPQRLITTPIEHEAVQRTVNQMEQFGFAPRWLAVDHTAVVDQRDFEQACAEGATLASIIYANNEVGTLQPIAEFAQIAHQHGILFHTDAVQAGGQLDLNVQTLGVDLLSLAAHKFYGPKGVGLLYVREGVNLLSAQTGGSHENGRRAGTHNTPLIVGMAKALELAMQEREQRLVHFQQLRQWLIDEILARLPDAELTGHPTQRLPSHASFVLEGIESNQLLMHLDMRGVAASSGSACKTGNPEPSGVLLAMGYSRTAALGSLRLTLGKDTTQDDIAYTVDQLVASVAALKKVKKVQLSNEQ